MSDNLKKEKLIPKRFNFTEQAEKQISELSEERGCTQTALILELLGKEYVHDIVPEHILMGRMNQLQAQITAIDRKLETLAGIYYMVMPYILGVLPPLPKNETNAKGEKYNPGLDKGNDIFTKLIINYRNQIKMHKISFMQNVWADMQENLNMTHINATDKEVYERTTGD